MSASAYPLQWPEGWPRTKRREEARFSCTFAKARDGIIRELGLMGVPDWKIVISSNVALRRDGLPYANHAEPDDVGIAVYWSRRTLAMNTDEQRVIAWDRWRRTRDNLRAIEKTIEAMRGIKRWGSTDIVNKVFRGFTALPEPVTGWRAVLGFTPSERVEESEVKTVVRNLMKIYHPDRHQQAADPTASEQKAKEILAARDEALREIGR